MLEEKILKAKETEKKLDFRIEDMKIQAKELLKKKSNTEAEKVLKEVIRL